MAFVKGLPLVIEIGIYNKLPIFYTKLNGHDQDQHNNHEYP